MYRTLSQFAVVLPDVARFRLSSEKQCTRQRVRAARCQLTFASQTVELGLRERLEATVCLSHRPKCHVFEECRHRLVCLVMQSACECDVFARRLYSNDVDNYGRSTFDMLVACCRVDWWRNDLVDSGSWRLQN